MKDWIGPGSEHSLINLEVDSGGESLDSWLFRVEEREGKNDHFCHFVHSAQNPVQTHLESLFSAELSKGEQKW